METATNNYNLSIMLKYNAFFFAYPMHSTAQNSIYDVAFCVSFIVCLFVRVCVLVCAFLCFVLPEGQKGPKKGFFLDMDIDGPVMSLGLA